MFFGTYQYTHHVNVVPDLKEHTKCTILCKNFWSWATSFFPMDTQNMYFFVKIPYMGSEPKWKNEVGQLQKNFDFLKVSIIKFNIHFEAREAVKTRRDRAFWNLTHKKRHFLSNSVHHQSPSHDIYTGICMCWMTESLEI